MLYVSVSCSFAEYNVVITQLRLNFALPAVDRLHYRCTNAGICASVGESVTGQQRLQVRWWSLQAWNAVFLRCLPTRPNVVLIVERPWHAISVSPGSSERPAVVANLSARVGSISDNQLGGWYSYRCA